MAEYKDVDAILHKLPNDLPYKAAVKRVLIMAPVADVRPVVRSKWEQVEVTEITETNMPHAVVSMYCPNCKRYHNQVYFYGNPIENVNFCPYCGADMKEG